MNFGWSENKTPIWEQCFKVAPGGLKQYWKKAVAIPLCEKREAIVDQVDRWGLRVDGDASLWASGPMALADPEPANAIALLEYISSAPLDMDLVHGLAAESHMPTQERDVVVLPWIPSAPGAAENLNNEQTLRALRNYVTDCGRVGCPIIGRGAA